MPEDSSMTFAMNYFRNIDNERSLLADMYSDTGRLSWAGKMITGSREIGRFLKELPSTIHKISGVTCVVEGQVLLVSVFGRLIMDDSEMGFHRSFRLTKEVNDSKIVHDYYRPQ